MSIKDKYAVAGLGVTKQGKLPDVTTREVAREAMELALADANLKRADIDGFIYQSGLESDTYDCRYLGISPMNFWSMQAGGATAGATVMAAIGAIEAGVATTVLCMGASRLRSANLRLGAVAYGYAQTWGLVSPIANHALNATRHMAVFGTTHEQLGSVAVTQREYACMRPEAMEYGKPITLDDYFASPWIAHPFRLLDCTRDTDGGVALIVTSAERARALTDKPVYIMGVGAGCNIQRWHDKTVYQGLDCSRPRESAFRTAGISTDDVDVFECYDAFTINVIMQLEGYGFCAEGEGGPFVEAGETKLGGKMPTNTAGGQLSGWYAQGFTPLTEGIRQMRGECGGAQVEGAEIALVTGHGGNAGVHNTWNHSCLVLRR